VPQSGQPQKRPDTGCYELLDACSRYYCEQLAHNTTARGYLEGRGLSDEVIRDFSIGYAPDAWDALIRHFGGESRKLDLLQRAGMLSTGKKGSYDKFRNRIMFPIHDRRGRVIAFGGRALADDGPKYLNSPETELYHKGRELYGLYLARQRKGRLDEIIVVEGYMDVVALAQFGLRNAVATSGTATTPMQVEMLFRASDTVVFCFDGDEAGRKAAWRALEATLPKLREGYQARFLFLPEGEDPDSMVRKHGRDEFERRVAGASGLSEFFFDHFKADTSSLDGRAKLVEQALPYIEKVPAGVFRDMLREKLETIAQHRLQGPVPVPAAAKAGQRGKPLHKRTPIRTALAYLVQDPSLVENIAGVEDLDGLGNDDLSGLEIFVEIVDFCRRRPNITTAQLLELWHGHPVVEHLQKLAVWLLPGEEEQQVQEFVDAVNRIRLQCIDIKLSRVTNVIAQQDEYRALQGRRQDLKTQLESS